MSRRAPCVLLVALAACACSDSGPGKTLLASFVADELSPVPKTVALATGASRADLVTIEVRVTDVENLYGASFYLVYDPAIAVLAGSAPGNVLEFGGHVPVYQVQESQPFDIDGDGDLDGLVTVAASRLGDVGPVEVAGTGVLLSLTFRVHEVGTSAVEFQSAVLFDGQLLPEPLDGIEWFGGHIVAN